MWKYFRMAWAEAKKQKAEDEKKARFINKKIDYAYLEELVQKVNENPNLRFKITHKDGTVLEINTKPKSNPLQLIEEPQEYVEVR